MFVRSPETQLNANVAACLSEKVFPNVLNRLNEAITRQVETTNERYVFNSSHHKELMIKPFQRTVAFVRRLFFKACSGWDKFAQSMEIAIDPRGRLNNKRRAIGWKIPAGESDAK